MKFLILDHCDRAVLSFEELTTVKRNLQTDGNVEVDYELIRETWHPVYRRHFLRKALRRCHDCRRGFFMYSKGIESDVSFRILTRFYPQDGICIQKYNFWPKNDGKKWSRKNIFEIPPCGRLLSLTS